MTETPARHGTLPKQLNIRLPKQTHRELKAKCALDGRSLVDAIEDLILQYLVGKVKVELPKQTHRELKAKCALDGRSLVDVPEDLIRQYLEGKVKLCHLAGKVKRRRKPE